MAPPKQKQIVNPRDILKEMDELLKLGMQSSLTRPGAIKKLAEIGEERKGKLAARLERKEQFDPKAVELAIGLAALLDAAANTGNVKILNRWG